jgi:drug/metabolite transporter (DMT)-like permease
MDWLPLALLCAFSLATADALTKRHLADHSARDLVLVRFGGTGLLLAPLLLVAPPGHIDPRLWAWVGLLLPLEILAMLLYVRAIRDCPLSLTLPYLAFTPVLTALTGYLVLGETVSARGGAGVGLVVAGAYLLNLGPAQAGAGPAWLQPLREPLRQRGARLMLAVAGIYSLTAVMGKAALAYLPPLTFGALYYGLLGIATLVAFGAGHPRRLAGRWRRPGWQLAVALALAVMVVTHFLAISRVEVPYMLAVKRTSLLFGILYGAIWFGEPGLTRHLLAGGLMLAGVVLLTV